MNKIQKLFRLFASLKLTIFLLVILGIAFSAGTFIESYHGAAAAQAMIYRTGWIAFLYLLLALNLAASAFDRLPWKRKHLGFLTTHLGIILMLAGALVTQVFGIEGQVQIQEGAAESRMSTPESFLRAAEVNSDRRWVFPLKRHAFPWEGREKLHSGFAAPFELALTRDYPKAKRSELIEKKDDGTPGLHVILKGSAVSMDEWLILDHPEKGLIHAGPAAIRFSKEPIKIEEKKQTSEWGSLIFDFHDGQTVKIPLDSKSAGKTFSLEGTPFRIQIDRILKDAVVGAAGGLEARSEEWNNPAVQFALEGNGISEHHTVFAKYPGFPTLHGRKESSARVLMAYHVPHLISSDEEENEIRFVFRAGALPEYQVKTGEHLSSGAVALNQEMESGWSDIKFLVDTYEEHISVEETYEPLPNVTRANEAIPVVRAEFDQEGQKQSIWLTEGELAYLQLGSANYHVVYGFGTRLLGFQVELKDFIMDTDPGTSRPASFKSRVILKDPARGIEREHLIQMNEPLKYRGFKLYQSGYHVEPGRPDVSILTAARDPGNPFKYFGAAVMTLGILVLFYTKQFSTLKGSDPKLRSR